MRATMRNFPGDRMAPHLARGRAGSLNAKSNRGPVRCWFNPAGQPAFVDVHAIDDMEALPILCENFLRADD